MYNPKHPGFEWQIKRGFRLVHLSVRTGIVGLEAVGGI
jgi:hypothetical protein